MSSRFALIGAAGYVASKHLKAIKECNCELIVSLDKSDSVGILDMYFPNSSFFTEYERFDRHLEKLRRLGEGIDFLSVCSPSYLHDAHCRLGLRLGADVICEKPLVLNPWNIDALEEMQQETGRKIFNILQLRLHPSIVALKERIDSGDTNKTYEVDLAYFTSRGRWYDVSWKGDIHKSGGITTNIGIHFFDMLTWIFGRTKEFKVHISEKDVASGYLELERAKVRWILSTNYDYIPMHAKEKGMRTYRSITLENEEIEFSDGFNDLHTLSYQHILDGRGFGLDEVRNCIQTVHDIRNSEPIGLKGDYHPLARKL